MKILMRKKSPTMKRNQMTICDCRIISPGGRKSQGEWRTGITTHPLYGLWRQMKYRCKLGTRYEKNYASRGIGVCSQWLEDFRVFLKDMGDRPSKKHSLDRKDNNGSYCPHNCRWATQHQQIMNSRVIKRKGNLPRWINLTKWGTYVVKRSISGRVIRAGVFKTRVDALKAAKKIGVLYGT